MQTVGRVGALAYPQKWGSDVAVRTLGSSLLLLMVALLGLGLEDAAEQDLVGGPGLVDDDGVGGRGVEREGALLRPALRVGVAPSARLQLAVFEARHLGPVRAHCA